MAARGYSTMALQVAVAGGAVKLGPSRAARSDTGHESGRSVGLIAQYVLHVVGEPWMLVGTGGRAGRPLPGVG